MALAVECVWVGPFLSDLNCSSCVLGYETTSETNATCVKPEFRPHRHWKANYSRLRLQDTRGIAIAHDTGGTDAPILLTGHSYEIPAPRLEPKTRLFAGYKLPDTKIHYELDFSRGAEVGATSVHQLTPTPAVMRHLIIRTHPFVVRESDAVLAGMVF